MHQTLVFCFKRGRQQTRSVFFCFIKPPRPATGNASNPSFCFKRGRHQTRSVFFCFITGKHPGSYFISNEENIRLVALHYGEPPPTGKVSNPCFCFKRGRHQTRSVFFVSLRGNPRARIFFLTRKTSDS